MHPQQAILKAEQEFAREVALGVIVTRPLKSWLYLIPGMFIVDFLRRQKAIRQYVQHYMAPRQAALKGAARLVEGQDSEKVREDLTLDNGQWLAAQGHSHPDLVAVRMALIELLMTHYGKLLNAPSQNYHQMMRSAYANKDDLRHMANRMNEVEFQRDRLMDSTAMGSSHSLDATRSQVVMRRNRLIDAIF